MDVDGLAERLPMRTLVEWIEYYKQHPFGDDWAQAATVAAATMNPHIKRSVAPDKFIPRIRRKRQTAAEMTAALDELRRRQNG